jgi:hypothetical protein
VYNHSEQPPKLAQGPCHRTFSSVHEKDEQVVRREASICEPRRVLGRIELQVDGRPAGYEDIAAVGTGSCL